MSNAVYAKKAIVAKLTEARKEHADAIAKGQEDAKAEVAKLAEAFTATGKNQFSEEPVLVTADNGLIEQIDAVLEIISILAGDEIPADSLYPHNIADILSRAGKVSSAKRTITVGIA